MVAAAAAAVIKSVRFQRPLHCHLLDRVCLLNGTTARIELRNRPLGSRLTMKIGQGPPAFPHVAVLAILALGGTPGHAAGPFEVVAGPTLPSQYSRAANAPRLTTEPRRDRATAPNLKVLTYNLGAVIDPDSHLDLESFGRETSGLELPGGLGGKESVGVGLKVQAGTDWSSRIGTWSGPVARSMADYSKRFTNLLSGPVSLLPRDMQSRFTVGRHRIDVHIATAF